MSIDLQINSDNSTFVEKVNYFETDFDWSPAAQGK